MSRTRSLFNYGPTNVGKSTTILHTAFQFADVPAWAKIAKKAGIPDEQPMVTVIDADGLLEPLLDELEEVPSNLDIRSTRGMPPLLQAYKILYGSEEMVSQRIKDKGQIVPEHVFDLGVKSAGLIAWYQAQQVAIAKAYGLEYSEITLPHWACIERLGFWREYSEAAMIEKLSEAKDNLGLYALQKAGDPQKDATGTDFSPGQWTRIKTITNGIIQKTMKELPVNTLVTAAGAPIPTKRDGSPLWDVDPIFERTGCRPLCQGDVPGNAEVILFLRKIGKQHEWTPVKHKGVLKNETKYFPWNANDENFWENFFAQEGTPLDTVPGLPQVK